MANIALELQKIASNATIQAQKLANQSTEKTFKYNQQEANTARKWQEQMSNTAHQREVKDLIKAGLNPVLSTNQGAQSYTTSSASAQANDPSSAAASLAASQMSGMAQGYSADQSAAATRYAAKQSAAAMREAAAVQASAARYAAAMNYQTQKDSWTWKTQYMKEEYKQKTNYALNTPPTSFAGLVDKYLSKSGVANSIVGSKTVKSAVSGIRTLLNDPKKFFTGLGDTAQYGINKVKSSINKNNAASRLSSAGIKLVNSSLAGMSIKASSTTRRLAVKAFLYGDSSAMTQLSKYMPQKPKKKASSAKQAYVLARGGRLMM